MEDHKTRIPEQVVLIKMLYFKSKTPTIYRSYLISLNSCDLKPPVILPVCSNLLLLQNARNFTHQSNGDHSLYIALRLLCFHWLGGGGRLALSAVIGWSFGGAVAVLVSALARPAVVISISVRTVSSGLSLVSSTVSSVMGDNTGHSMETNTNNHQQPQQDQHQVLSLSRTGLLWALSL